MNIRSLADLEAKAEFGDAEAIDELCKKLTSEDEVKSTDEQLQRWQKQPNSAIFGYKWDIPWYESVESFNSLFRAAELALPLAQYVLAGVLADPDHPEYSPSEALRWLGKAATHGVPELLDRQAPKVLQSIREQAVEVKDYRDAAQEGDAEAQFQMGFIYFYGQGVDINKREAMKWWVKAEANGHERAKQAILNHK